MTKISLGELKKILPVGAFFTVRFTGELNSQRQGNAGRRKVLKWSKKELTCERCSSSEETYVALNDDFYAYWRGKVIVFAYRESGEFAELSDIQSGANYTRKGLGAWE